MRAVAPRAARAARAGAFFFAGGFAGFRGATSGVARAAAPDLTAGFTPAFACGRSGSRAGCGCFDAAGRVSAGGSRKNGLPRRSLSMVVNGP
ncbi:MAG: hypothetical protein ABSG63_10855, partial [Spirochaetia bacterium]